MKRFAFTAGFCALLACSAIAGGLVAAENGVATADIVLPANPNQAEVFAAEELKYHLEKATGGKFVIASEEGFNAKLRKCHFYVGATAAAQKAGLKMKFEMDEYAVDRRAERIFLRGGDRDGTAVGNSWSAACQGTLYAVYEFLEKKMGVKWIWPGETGEVVPKSPNLTFDKVSLSGKTPLVMRTWRLGPPGKSTLGWAGGAAQRDAFYESQKKFLVRHRQGSRMCFNYGHNFSNWWKRFGKTHPEYFAKLCNGKRETMKGDEGGQYSMLCESEPGVWRQIVADWLRSPERKPGNIPYKPYLNLCENDSPGMCTCERCRAWDAPDPRFETTPYWQGRDPLTRLGRFYRLARVGWGEEGVSKVKLDPPSLSDRFAKFYNAVLAEAKKVVPDARAVGYAYANYVDAPTQTKVDPSLCLMFVPSAGYPYPTESRERFRREWLGWQKAGVKDFLLRPNYMLSGGNFPVNFGRGIAEDFAFAYTNGMFGCYFDSLISSWGASAPMYYVLARAIREPLVGYDTPIKEFCSSFGAAASRVRDYVEFVAAHDRSLPGSKFNSYCRENQTVQGSQGGGSGSFCLVAADVFDEKWFADADAILADAARAAAGDADSEGRIAFLRKGLKDALLTRRVRAAQKSGDKAAFAAAFAEMKAYRASVEREGVANYGYLATSERYSAGWPHK